MDALKKNLKQREQRELLTIIEHMRRQEPELEWLLHTSLPSASSRRTSIDPKIFQQQVVAAIASAFGLVINLLRRTLDMPV